VSKIIDITHTHQQSLERAVYSTSQSNLASHSVIQILFANDKKTFPRKTCQTVVSSPLTGRPKLRNFLPGACGGSSSPLYRSKRHDSRTSLLTPTRRGIPGYCQRISSYSNMITVKTFNHIRIQCLVYGSSSDVTLQLLKRHHSLSYL